MRPDHPTARSTALSHACVLLPLLAACVDLSVPPDLERCNPDPCPTDSGVTATLDMAAIDSRSTSPAVGGNDGGADAPPDAPADLAQDGRDAAAPDLPPDLPRDVQADVMPMLPDRPADLSNDLPADMAVPPPDINLPPEMICQAMPNGTACDDRNICTPSSTCQGGQCVPAAQVTTCMVAGSVSGWSNVQGRNGWWYGSWSVATDPNGTYQPATDFRLMTWETNVWREKSVSWSYLASAWEHSTANPRVLSVRRWVSDVSGPARVRVVHRKSDPSGGDGTRAILNVDGVTVWTHDVAGTDGVGITQDINVKLEIGSTVDQLLDPIGSDGQDTSEYSVTVHSP